MIDVKALQYVEKTVTKAIELVNDRVNILGKLSKNNSEMINTLGTHAAKLEARVAELERRLEQAEDYAREQNE